MGARKNFDRREHMKGLYGLSRDIYAITSHRTGKTHATEDGVKTFCGRTVAQYMDCGMWLTKDEWLRMVWQETEDLRTREPLFGVRGTIHIGTGDDVAFPCRRCTGS